MTTENSQAEAASPEQVEAARRVVESLLVFFVNDFPWASQIYYLMDKKPSSKVSTMGVSVKNNQATLHYNPTFVLGLDRAEVSYVMVHEAFHVLFHHVTTRTPSDPQARQAWNIAADLAVNSLIGTSMATCRMPVHKVNPVDPETGLPLTRPNGTPVMAGDHQGMLPSDFLYEDPSDGATKRMPDKMAMEWYFAALPQDGGGSQAHMDDHEGWDEASLFDEQIREAVRRISASRMWGNIPAEVVHEIEAAQSREVPWPRLLRHALGDMASKRKDRTTKRPNRRIPVYPWKGTVRTGESPKLVAFDTSGSVANEELAVALAEVNRLVEDEQEVHFVCFDTEVKGKAQPFRLARRSLDFKGRGGTNFQCAVDFAADNGYSDLIIFTDGEAPAPTTRNGLELLWILTADGTDRPPTGSPGRYVKMKKLKDPNFR